MLVALGILLCGYAAVLAWFRANEPRLIFFPDRGPTPVPATLAELGARAVSIATPDHLHLRGWAVPPPKTQPAAPWLLVLHGNAGNIATPGRIEHDAQLQRLGAGVLAFDYRGYGENEGEVSEAGLYRDAHAAYAFLRDSLGIPPERIVIYGHSLGSAVAVELASAVPAAGLIVEGAFTSAPDLGQELYPWLPVRALARSRFASLERIPQVTMPLLVIHGRDDLTIPIAHGRRLFAAARAPKTFLEVAGGHDDAFLVGQSEYEAGLHRFLGALR
jgi:fermentation-respiration switch protein FrsA (DUF1100 family)